MKKIIALVMAMTMLMALAACGNTNDTDVTVPDDSSSQVETTPEPGEPETPEVTEPETPETPEVTEVTEPETPEVPEDVEKSALVGTLEALVKDTTDPKLMTETIDVPADMFEYITGIAPVDGYKAAVSQAMVGSIAHKIVLVEVPEGVNAEDVAKTMEENMDPRWLICAEAEANNVTVHGQQILMVQSEQAVSNAIAKNAETVYSK